MKIRGILKDPLSYLRILTICTVLSTGSLIFKMVESTSAESTSGHLESLEVKVGELELRAIGKNTTEVLMNLMRNANRWGTMPIEEKSYLSTQPKEPVTLKKPNNSSYIMF